MTEPLEGVCWGWVQGEGILSGAEPIAGSHVPSEFTLMVEPPVKTDEHHRAVHQPNREATMCQRCGVLYVSQDERE